MLFNTDLSVSEGRVKMISVSLISALANGVVSPVWFSRTAAVISFSLLLVLVMVTL